MRTGSARRNQGAAALFLPPGSKDTVGITEGQALRATRQPVQADKQGIHPKIVQERLGHSSIQITIDTYSHVAPGLQQAAANKFDDIMLLSLKESEMV